MRFHLSLADLFKSEVKFKIIKFLLDHEAAMSEREIASILRISHMSVNRTMGELAEFNLVSYITVGKAHLWKVNHRSYIYGMLRKLMDHINGFGDPLMALKQMLIEKLTLKSVQKIVLFGSIAQDTEKPDSDIDVFILIKNNDGKDKLETALEKLSMACLEKFGNRLSPYVLTEQELRQKKGLEVFAAVNRGIQLYPPQKGKA